MTDEIDLDLVLMDFRDEYERDKQQALKMAQALLSDPLLCKRRMGFLHVIGADADAEDEKWKDVEDGVARGLAEGMQSVISLGTEEAVRQGRITPQGLSALLNHPVALWRVHQAMVADQQVDQQVDEPEPPMAVPRRGLPNEGHRSSEPASYATPLGPEQFFGVAQEIPAAQCRWLRGGPTSESEAAFVTIDWMQEERELVVSLGGLIKNAAGRTITVSWRDAADAVLAKEVLSDIYTSRARLPAPADRVPMSGDVVQVRVEEKEIELVASVTF